MHIAFFSQYLRTAADGSVTAYAYDVAGNRTTVTAPDREAVIFAYDACGREIYTQTASGEVLTETFYDESGRKLAETAGSGDAWRAVYYAYDALGRTVERVVCDAADAVVSRETAVYDDADANGYATVTQTLHGDADAADRVTVMCVNGWQRKAFNFARFRPQICAKNAG